MSYTEYKAIIETQLAYVLAEQTKSDNPAKYVGKVTDLLKMLVYSERDYA